MLHSIKIPDDLLTQFCEIAQLMESNLAGGKDESTEIRQRRLKRVWHSLEKAAGVDISVEEVRAHCRLEKKVFCGTVLSRATHKKESVLVIQSPQGLFPVLVNEKTYLQGDVHVDDRISVRWEHNEDGVPVALEIEAA